MLTPYEIFHSSVDFIPQNVKEDITTSLPWKRNSIIMEKPYRSMEKLHMKKGVWSL